MQASNFFLQPLDLVVVDFETLILIETKSRVHFSAYIMFFSGWTKHNSAGSIIVEISKPFVNPPSLTTQFPHK